MDVLDPDCPSDEKIFAWIARVNWPPVIWWATHVVMVACVAYFFRGYHLLQEFKKKMEPPDGRPGPPHDFKPGALTDFNTHFEQDLNPQPTVDPRVNLPTDITIPEHPGNVLDNMSMEKPEHIFPDRPMDIMDRPEAESDVAQPEIKVEMPRKKRIPARRLPKYLPDVDGNLWKVWPYPDFIELSSESEPEEGGTGRPTSSFYNDIVNSKIFKNVSSGTWYILISVNVVFILKALFIKWKTFVTKQRPEKVPWKEEESEEELGNIVS